MSMYENTRASFQEIPMVQAALRVDCKRHPSYVYFSECCFVLSSWGGESLLSEHYETRPGASLVAGESSFEREHIKF